MKCKASNLYSALKHKYLDLDSSDTVKIYWKPKLCYSVLHNIPQNLNYTGDLQVKK